MFSSKVSLQNRTARPFAVSYILIPGFSMLALSSAIEPLRSVNRLLSSDRYEWHVLGSAIGPVRAGNGLEIKAEYDFDHPPEADLTIIVASLELENYSNRKLMSHVRWLNRQGKMIGAVSNGTLLLAQAGVLSGRHVTIHWETLDELTTNYPDIDACAELFCIDKKIFTAVGGASSMDMMLELIITREGRTVAADVAEQFLHGSVRSSNELQRSDLRWRYRLTDKRLETVIRLMEKHQSSPLSVASLAATVDLSERHLERLFVKELGNTPSAFYRELRLSRARNRLLATTDSIEEIAEVSGFSSQAHFTRAFKAWCGASPMVVRRGMYARRVGMM